MKKVVLLLTVLIILSSYVFCISNFAFADEINNNTVYYEATQDIICHETSSLNSPVVTIPKTYYFKINGKGENYYMVEYNSYKFYCALESIDTYAKKTDLNNINTPHYALVIQDKEQKVDVFNALYEDYGTLLLREVSFIGYYLNNDVYYFYVSAKTSGEDVNTYIVKADDYSTNFSSAHVNLHPNSAELRKQQAQQYTKVAQNKLKRNIFFSVICFLCVVTVCLIYNPFKKKVLSQNHSATYTSEDDF